jgi:hypothetical protein
LLSLYYAHLLLQLRSCSSVPDGNISEHQQQRRRQQLLQLRWRRWIPTTTMLWVRVQVALQMPHAVVIPVLALAALALGNNNACRWTPFLSALTNKRSKMAHYHPQSCRRFLIIMRMRLAHCAPTPAATAP